MVAVLVKKVRACSAILFWILPSWIYSELAGVKELGFVCQVILFLANKCIISFFERSVC